MKTYIYPENLRANVKLWFWSVRDFIIICTGVMKSWYKHILGESKKYEHIFREWQRKKSAYDKKIQENEQKIEKLNEDIENLIMERLNDLGRKELYDKMINKKEKEVKELDKKNKELKQYNLVCKKRQEELDNFAEFLKDVLAQDTISDISLRARSGQENRRRNDRCCVQWH